MTDQTRSPARPLEGRVALITGASRGIGAAVARRLAAEGAHPILVARTTGGLEEVDDQIKMDGNKATLVPLDLRQPETIAQLAAAVYERFRGLDILVGNAGQLGGLSPVGHIDPGRWEEVMAVNLAANWHLIRQFDPILRQSQAGRALFVTCAAAEQAKAYWGAYAASKSALETLVKVWAGELGQTRVKANLIDPGPVRTRLRMEAYPGEDPDDLPAPESITDAFVELARSDCPHQGEIIRL